MAKEKKDKKEIELEEASSSEDTPKAPEKRKRVEKRKMTFDVYFQALMKRDSKVAKHHKAAMRKYLEQQDFKEGTEEDFDRAFRLY